MLVKSLRGSSSGPRWCPRLQAPRETDRAVAQGLEHSRCLQQKRKEDCVCYLLLMIFSSPANEGLLGRMTHLRSTSTC